MTSTFYLSYCWPSPGPFHNLVLFQAVFPLYLCALLLSLVYSCSLTAYVFLSCSLTLYTTFSCFLGLYLTPFLFVARLFIMSPWSLTFYLCSMIQPFLSLFHDLVLPVSILWPRTSFSVPLPRTSFSVPLPRTSFSVLWLLFNFYPRYHLFLFLWD